MAQTLSTRRVSELVRQHYGVEVKSTPLLLNQRDENQVFKVELSGDHSLTLRLSGADRTVERVLADTGALLFLAGANFPAPKLELMANGERIFEWQANCWGYATQYLAGDVLERIDLPTLQEVAYMLATLHKLATNPIAYPLQVHWLDDLQPAIARAESCFENFTWGTLAKDVTTTLKALPDLHGLPLGLVHTDVHEGNLLRTSDGTLYLLDWEDAGLGEAVLDVGIVLAWNCVWRAGSPSPLFGGLPDLYNFDEEYCRAFLTAYQRVRRLSQPEAESLGNVIRFLMGWFAARDIEREIAEPGVSDGLAFTSWAIMRSVTPEWERTLTKWAVESAEA